ncbi:MAG: hypothetical protein F4Y00_07655 [Bacteroidetes bacterium SB0662_bin_6]|nr:hypothetical protein [Bacteroidetes bacterium SB0662_bin_6]
MTPEAFWDLLEPPDTNPALLPAWAEQRPLFDFLEQQRRDGPIVLYAGCANTGSLLVDALLVPLKTIAGFDSSKLHSWDSMFASPYCGLVEGGGLPPRVEFEPGNHTVAGTNLPDSTRLIFHRHFEGRTEDADYFEVSPSLTHPHDLHWVPERQSWCRFDGNGDVESVIQLVRMAPRGTQRTATIITIAREIIELHMSAADSVVIQMFDSTCINKNFSRWQGHARVVSDHERNLHYSALIEPSHQSYVRGLQVLHPRKTAEELGAALVEEKAQSKRYESYTIADWRNSGTRGRKPDPRVLLDHTKCKLVTASCNPNSLASYFDPPSTLPFQISPAFFKPDVLNRYLADPDKYSVDDQSISCRNAWHLKIYRVNDAKQIYTYVTYLGNLPHSEQVYWKSFNEAPRAGMTQSAYDTDFHGNWLRQENPIRDVRRTVSDLEARGVGWFKLREPDLLNGLHRPLTEAHQSWNDVVGKLAKLVNEGLQKRFFAKSLKHLPAGDVAGWGSIRCAEEVLKAADVPSEVVAEAIEPIRELQRLRTKLVAHSGGSEAQQIRSGLIRTHGSPYEHIDDLCRRLAHSLQLLDNFLSQSN